MGVEALRCASPSRGHEPSLKSAAMSGRKSHAGTREEILGDSLGHGLLQTLEGRRLPGSRPMLTSSWASPCFMYGLDLHRRGQSWRNVIRRRRHLQKPVIWRNSVHRAHPPMMNGVYTWSVYAGQASACLGTEQLNLSPDAIRQSKSWRLTCFSRFARALSSAKGNGSAVVEAVQSRVVRLLLAGLA